MQRVTIIEAGRRDREYWLDLWRYRELFIVLAWRDLAVRYKQTIIGISWAIIRPLATVLIFTFVFGRIANLPSDGRAPYILMVFVGMLPWTFFSSSLADASNSLINNANLVSKVFFPRALLPLSAFGVALVDFAINLFILIGLLLWYRYVPGVRLLAMPVFIALAFFASLGPALWFAALNVKYRDFRYIVPFVVQFGLYLSPVGFSSGIVPEQWRLLYSCNPLVGVIDGFRWCILGEPSELYLPGLVAGAFVNALLLWTGIHNFKKLEKQFADVI